MVRDFHNVSLIGLSDRAKKIISFYENKLLIKEYDDYGKSLNTFQNKPAIFCISPDGFWNGWFILDEDVRFEQEYRAAVKALNLEKK